MARHHFTLLVTMVTITLSSISSERNTVTHHVSTSMARHHFTLLVVMVISTLLSISSERNTVTHHVGTLWRYTTSLYLSYGQLNIAQYLIREEHCNPSCEDKYGETPLHYACTDGYLDIAQYLIREEHCNPSCEDINGETPLHLLVIWSTQHYSVSYQRTL